MILVGDNLPHLRAMADNGVARKPLAGTVAANVLAHGTGALNIDGCRVGDEVTRTIGSSKIGSNAFGDYASMGPHDNPPGRWPANVLHDGSDEVLAAFPQAPGQLAKASTSDTQRAGQNTYGVMARGSNGAEPRSDAGSTGKAAALEGFRFIGIEQDPAFAEIAKTREAHAIAAYLDAAVT